MKALVGLAIGLALLCGLPAQAAEPTPQSGLSIFGDLKYGPDFQHFDYVDPAAPKGGELHLPAIDSFDSLNPFILKGVAADGLDLGLVYESLMLPSEDEPDAVYALIAKSVELDPGRSITFNLDPRAQFSDGSPVTAEDVVFTFNALLKDGHPRYAIFYRDVDAVTAEGAARVVFRFKPTATRDLPVLVAGLPVLSKTYFGHHDFARTTLEPILGSGPYTIAKVEPGRSITYARAPNHWAKDLPVYRGRFNYDRIRYDYYRDRDVAFEAFFSDQYDFNDVPTSKHWATGYDRPPVRKGLIQKEVLPDRTPSGLQAYFFNLRRAKFQDRRVREALSLAFDFEWSNKTLFYGIYKRTRSMFENTEFAATGLPSPAELKLLEPFRAQVPPEVFTAEYNPPSTNESNTIRDNLRKAQELLKQAGWVFKGQQLVDGKTRAPFGIEFLIFEQIEERIIGPYAQNLQRLGIDAHLRLVDIAAFQRRQDTFDYDVITRRFAQTLTPGIEQRNYWGSATADTEGTLNAAGVKDPAVDALIEKVIRATDRASLMTASHALDRVLTWNFYVLPQMYSGTFKIAYWNKFGRPATQPKFALGMLDTWWIDLARQKQIADGIAPPALAPQQQEP
jgi:microcin C transport system substrate-binding protein